MSLQTYSAAQILTPESKDLFEEIVLLVSYAFSKDPGNKWLFSNHTREQYIQKLPHLNRFLLLLALNAGASVTVSRDSTPITKESSSQETKATDQSEIQLPKNATIKSLGVIIPPEGNEMFESGMNAIRSGVLTLPWYCGLDVAYKMIFKQVPVMNAMKDAIWPPPNARKKNEVWHLLILATHPDAQGQGLGKRILLEFKRLAMEASTGEKKMPLYLESSTLGSKRLYERVGFVQHSTAKYGDCRPDQDVTIDENGRVLGGTWYGMLCDP